MGAPVESRYPQVLRALFERPWAVMPETLFAIRELVTLRVQGVEFSEEETRERIDSASYAGPRQVAATSRGTNVAVLPLAGVIVPKASLFSEVSGATSVEGFQRDLRAAVADPEIGAIVMDVDSPGGNTALVSELAAEIRDARDSKPIVAVANTLMASAAYWLASQATEVVGSPSALVGSVGVYAAHEDISQLQDKLGVKTTVISAGKYKTEGLPFEPLTDSAKEHMQSLVTDAYGRFVSDVAAGRGVDESTVLSGYGEGRVLSATAALKAGMVDRIDTLEGAITRVARDVTGSLTTNQARAANGLATTATTSGSNYYMSLAGHVPASYAEVAEAAHAAVSALASRTRSLAEFRRGQLTVAKREQIAEVLSEAEALAELLTATDPESRPTAENALTLDDEWALASLGLTL